MGRPDAEGTYDRTQEYEDRKLSLSFGGRKPTRNEDIKLVLEGERVRLICEAGDSKPAPRFRWKFGRNMEDQKPLLGNRTNLVQRRRHGGANSASVHEFVARPEDNGKVFSCFAANKAISNHQELSATVTILVLCEFYLQALFWGTLDLWTIALYRFNKLDVMNIR